MTYARPSRSPLALAAAAAAAVVLGGALLSPAAASTSAVDLQPQRLSRGADIAVPHIADGDFVDGARRIELPGTVARVIGRSGDAWVVGTSNADRNRNRRVVRVEPDGSVVTILRDLDESSAVLSADGSTLAWQRYVGRGSRTITYVASALDGSELGSRGPDRATSLLDVSSDTVLLSSTRRTLAWRFAADRSRTVLDSSSSVADIEHDLLAYYTRDPYQGGCTKLVRLSDPATGLWRSCTERLWSVAPDGSRMGTVDILADGIGPGVVTVREVDGTRVARYRTGWFDAFEWESPTTVLLGVNGRTRSATVRCTVDACENATYPVPVRQPRAR